MKETNNRLDRPGGRPPAGPVPRGRRDRNRGGDRLHPVLSPPMCDPGGVVRGQSRLSIPFRRAMACRGERRKNSRFPARWSSRPRWPWPRSNSTRRRRAAPPRRRQSSHELRLAEDRRASLPRPRLEPPDRPRKPDRVGSRTASIARGARPRKRGTARRAERRRRRCCRRHPSPRASPRLARSARLHPAAAEPSRPRAGRQRPGDAPHADLQRPRSEFTEALASYYYFRDDARFGGWQSYLQRSDDFIRFCCHMHIWEMLTARGGAGETRVVWRWPKIR